MVKHFSIEEGFKTQAEIEALVVNNPALTVDCSYYKSAFEFVAGVPTDTLGETLTFAIDGTVTVPSDNIGIEVDNTVYVTLEDFFLTEDYVGSVQVVFTGEIVGNPSEINSVVILSQTSDIWYFARNGVFMDNGGDVFTGHSDTGGVWVFSASFIDNNQNGGSTIDRFVGFELFEVGGSLTNHGRSGLFD